MRRLLDDTCVFQGVQGRRFHLFRDEVTSARVATGVPQVWMPLALGLGQVPIFRSSLIMFILSTFQD